MAAGKKQTDGRMGFLRLTLRITFVGAFGAFLFFGKPTAFGAPAGIPPITTEVPAPLPPPPPPQAFYVSRIEVIGATLISMSEIEPLVKPYEGRDETLDDLKKAANEITRLYIRKGYLLGRAFVPPQEIEHGVARILVIEGRVESLQVEGNRSYSSSFIEYFVKNAIHNGLLDFGDFEKALLLLNEFPDLQVKSYIRPGKNPGSADVTIQAIDKTPIHEGIDYNNFGNRFTGRNRAGLEIWDGDLTGRGDLADFRTVFPFPSNANPFYQVEYAIPISRGADKFSASFSTADIKAGQELAVLDIRGTAQQYGFNFIHPIDRTLTVSSDLQSSFYIKNVRYFLFGGTLSSSDKIRELVETYDRRWYSRETQDLLEVSASQGLGTLFSGLPVGNTIASRVGADDTFTKFYGDIIHIMKSGPKNFWILRGEGQIALSPLTTTEQMSVGGPDSVRGYQQAEILGDSAWAFTSEFRYGLTPPDAPTTLQLAFSLGTGDAILRFPQAGEIKVRHITGAGVGVRAGIGRSTSMRLDLGFPIDPGANSVNENPVLYAQFATQF